MKKKILMYLVIVFYFSPQFINAQEVKGIRGIEINPYVFSMKNLKSIGDLYIGPDIRSDFNEAEPPYAPPYPSPDANSIQHMTYDKSTGVPSFAPIAGTNFEGILQTTAIPSEPQLAAGPNNIFILGNVSVKITDKTGATLSSVTQSTFFNIPTAEGPGFDSKCFYDYRRGRFLALCETQTSSPKVCNYYLAVSATSDAMGTWYIYKFDMTKNGATQTSNWSDFPGLGISDDKLVMSGQQFSFAGNLYQYQKLRIIDRAAAYSGGTVTYTDIVNWSGQQFVTKPGRNMSTGNDVYIFATKYNGGTTVEFRTLTGTPASPVLSAGTNITVSSYGASLSSVPGGSASSTVNTGDCRTPDFFVRNNVLNIAFHMGATIGGTSVTAIKFLRITVNPLNTAPLTDETYGAASTYYYYPMTCLDSAGTMFLGFGRSSTSEFPSSYITGKRRSDASIESSTLAKAGTAVTSQSRWGDFTGIDMDESASGAGGSFAWYSGQYTKGSNTFGSWVTQMNFTYGRISGQVLSDADGDVTTTGDRTPASGVTVTLKQGLSVLSTTTTDVSGNYNFGYLETGSNYSIAFTPPSGKHSVDVIPGSGGTTQTKTDYKTIAVNLTNAQTSTSNNYIISDWLPSIANGNWNGVSTWSDNTTPLATDKVLITSGTTVTVNSNFTCQNINAKGVLQFDNISPRTLTVNSNLNLSNGSITLGSNNIIIGASGSVTGVSASRYIITNAAGTLTVNGVGNSDVLFPVGTAAAYNPATINNSGSADNFSVRVQNNFDFTVPYADVVNKQWTITEGTPGGSNASVRLQWNASDENATFNRNSGLYIARYNGTTWVQTPASALSGTDPYTTTATGFTSFSPFIIENQAPLPVELSSFVSGVVKNDVTLNWETTNEINNTGFDIERANVVNGNAGQYNKIGFVQGKGTVNVPSKYTYADTKLNSGKYNYRLKQIDNNGNYHYYNLSISVDVGTPSKYNLSQNYPNPFNPSTKIDYELPADSRVKIVLFDISGRELKTIVNDTKKAGYYTARIDGSNLASGIYFIRIQSEKFSDTKKIVLLK